MKNRSAVKRVCVYCASSPHIDRRYFEETRALSRLLVQAGIEVVYGGGAKGLMGCLADSIMEYGGKIKGIMPKFMNEVEWAHKSVEDMEFTESMHERKARFLEEVDALIALPGGSGTLEELLESITFKRLGLFHGPIAILNTNDYYAPLKVMLERSIAEGFMKAEHEKLWVFVNHPQEILDVLRAG